jgi:uncharacterized protein
MAKPTGSRCNLNCAYCFFLKKDRLYPDSNFSMSDEVMEQYIHQTIEAHKVPEVTIAWQGGEPTLMGLDFFRRAVAVEQKYLKSGMRIENTLQTNGVLIDEEWCRFFHDHNFLIGLSIDGPREMHDAYRHDRGGHSVFDKVVRAVRLMQQHKVDFNILCTINAVNSQQPLELYRFFRDELKAQYIQFIPIVERANDTGDQTGTEVTERSVQPGQYGKFLIEIFDEWVKRDVGKMFVQFFDGVLASYVRGRSSLCILSPTCGEGVALEHNGDVYSCDHFVEPDFLLGNITKTALGELVSSQQQWQFGAAKTEGLPRYCRECEFLFTCHGECPKNRILNAPDGEPGANWLCAGLKDFFDHTRQHMQIMAELLRRGRTADGIMNMITVGDLRDKARYAGVGRNDPCPCGAIDEDGGAVKFKKCHGR